MVNLPTTQITMTSLELVDYINAERAEKAGAAGVEFPSKGHPQLRHADFMTKVPKVLGENHSTKFFAQYTDSTGRDLPCFRFPKREACLLAMSYSYELQAKVFDHMTELEQQLAQPQLAPARAEQVRSGLWILETAARMLNLSNSSRLAALQQLQEFAGVPIFLPAYAIDAPSDATDGSSRTTAAITTLLARYGSDLSAPAANRILERLGILERKQRPSTRYGQRQFWSITNAGLVYGKNVTDPRSQRETQPHFYESRFPHLIERITSARGQC
ncbi:hypothetical protein [Martelella alba]|uniref:Rha family transcriptional regulator n=1 Tax=Martelella alba TaxID=2590451 RepID=A0ABY2SG54_9HYPH|nr:hypothetical protein [Martelella alba]TKI02408.1 hypothetical protein FCN80_25095 [Martelella alba]